MVSTAAAVALQLAAKQSPDEWDVIGLQFFIGLIVLCVLILAVVAYADHRKAKRKARRLPPPSPSCMRDYHRSRYIRS